MAEREYERENYKADHDLLKFYDAILEARVQTAKALNRYRAVDNGISTSDLMQELQNKSDTKQVFLNYLDMYYDLVKFKFSKSDVEEPDLDKDSIHKLDIEEGISLYEKCNELLEDLEITSIENLDKGRRVVG